MSVAWKEIKGYRWPYRINEEACVQKKLSNGEWYTLKPYLGGGRSRAMVKMRSLENKPIEVPLVWLMADAFLGGRRPGYAIVHRNEQKLDCSMGNLKFIPVNECGRISCRSRRKAVMKIDRSGNVVAIYASGREAAKKNYISQNSIWARCHGMVKDPFRLDGHDYRYEDGRRCHVAGGEKRANTV